MIPTTRGAALRWARQRLKRAGLDAPGVEAEMLVAEVFRVPRHAPYLDPQTPLTASEQERFVAAVARRARREPIQYLVGRETFCGLELAVTPDVLIPRPETEEVVSVALEAVAGRERPVVADLGTGSGCIALAVAAARPDAVVYAVDRSAAALRVARENAERLGLSARVQWLEGDWTDPLAAAGVRADLVVSNPPYVTDSEFARLQPEVRFEPGAALRGGPDGLVFYRRIVAEAGSVLATDGRVVIELGFGQAEAVRTLAEGAGWSVERVVPDFNGIARVVTLARRR